MTAMHEAAKLLLSIRLLIWFSPSSNCRRPDCICIWLVKMTVPLQIVMTANTMVLCYIATPVTPEEHVASSAVSIESCAFALTMKQL